MEDAQALEIRSKLTPKQAEAMDHLIQHMTTKQIALEMGLSPKTVDHHIAAAQRKLGATDRNAAARAWQSVTTHGEGFPRHFFPVDSPSPNRQLPLRDLPTSPVFTVSDAATFGAWELPRASRPGLEILDTRLGKFGRVAAIIVLASLLAITVLLSLAIADGLDRIF